MSARRSILAPVSRKSKKASQAKATQQADGAGKEAPPVDKPAGQPAKVRKKKSSSGMGMFGSWFNESPDYDEEEDSKTWEQPWALPPTPASSFFSAPSPPIFTGTRDKADRQRGGKAESDSKLADNHQSQTKTPRGRDATHATAKQDVKSKSKQGGKSQKATVKPQAKLSTPSPPTPLGPSKFFGLPLEVRDKIYGHLLTSDTNIIVLRGWTQCYVRYRGGLEPSILLACRQTYEEGIRILYSSNTFMYLMRDVGDPIAEALRPEGCVPALTVSLEPPPLAELQSSNSKGRAPKRQKRAKPVAKKSTVGDVNRVIYLAKYAHLLRRVEIVLESNRDEEKYGLAMAKAIQILGSGPGGVGAHLTFLQFSLTPLEVVRPGAPDGETDWTVVKFFTPPEENSAADAEEMPAAPKKKARPKKVEDYGVIAALRNLDVRLLRFTVYTPSSRRLDMTLDMTYRNTTGNDNSTADDLRSLLAHDNLISRQRRETASASAQAFDNLGRLIRAACEDTDRAVEDGWWSEYGPPQVAAVRSGMEAIVTIKERVRKYRTPWYEKLRDEYAAQPERACCVRKVGRRLLPASAE